MGAKSRIEWTDATWTPIRARRRDTGKVGVHCERVSEACRNCYAATFNRRSLPVHGTGLDFTRDNREKVEIFLDEDLLLAPLRWKRPRRIFVCSQTDLFGEFVPDEMIDRVFAVMALCPHHTFQVLTKRPERMLAWMTSPRPLTTVDSDVAHFAEHIGRIVFDSRGSDKLNYFGCAAGTDVSNRRRFPGWPLPHVWLGVTAEDQPSAENRIPLLLKTPAAVRFVSIEPMLGPVILAKVAGPHSKSAELYEGNALFIGDVGGIDFSWTRRGMLHWVITGGESGPGARPSHPDWFRSLRDQCVAAGVPFFHKQNGEWAFSLTDVSARPSSVHEFPDGTIMERVGKAAAGRKLDGVEWSQFPEATHA